MSTPMTPTELLAQLHRWGVPYHQTKGWRTRRRPASTGGFGPVHGACAHHTATRRLLAVGKKRDPAARRRSVRAVRRILIQGRPDLPGPLCQLDVTRGGSVGLIAAGRANHAGSIRPDVRDRLIADLPPQRPPSGGETVDGNTLCYGIENHNDGVGERYPAMQLLSLVLTNAAICDWHGWSENSVPQHRELTARKVDMHDIRGVDSGTWLRTEVAVALAAGPGRYLYPGWRPKPGKPGTHTVTTGDTPGSVAKAAGITVAALWRLNRARLRAGEKLRLR